MNKNPNSFTNQNNETDTAERNPGISPNLEPIEPAIEFKVDEKDYPTFMEQTEWRPIPFQDGHESRRLNIEQTLGRMVGSTAQVISAVLGEVDHYPRADHVIYLDKSARPVSWLVDEFWSDFAPSEEQAGRTTTEQPAKSFLSIDRRYWFYLIGVLVDPHGYILDEEGQPTDEKVTFRKFQEGFESPNNREKQKKILAGIHALYVEGGVSTEDPDEILKMPTILDDKNVLIVDEVADSGTTIEIAKYIMKEAINYGEREGGAKSINSYVFWRPGSFKKRIKDKDGNDIEIDQINSVPAWYPIKTNEWGGRGIKDPNPDYYVQKYEQEPSDTALAQKLGAFALGVPLINDAEDNYKSRGLREEIRKIRLDYEDGNILPFELGKGSVKDKIKAHLNNLGVIIGPKYDNSNPRYYISIKEKLKKV